MNDFYIHASTIFLSKSVRRPPSLPSCAHHHIAQCRETPTARNIYLHYGAAPLPQLPARFVLQLMKSITLAVAAILTTSAHAFVVKTISDAAVQSPSSSSSLLAAKGFGSPPPEPRKKSTGIEDLAQIGETIVNFCCNLQLIFLSLEDLLPLDCQS